MSNEIARQEFGAADMVVARPQDSSTAALSARSEAEAKSRFVMALNRPRDSAQARHRVLAACKRPRFADAAIFSIKRGRKKNNDGAWVDNYVEGLSIRAAEEFLRCWGNLQARDEVVHDDAESRIVRVEVIDLETNASFSRDVFIEKRIEKQKLKTEYGSNRVLDDVLGERINSEGEKIFIVRPTADELLTKQYALVSKALRTCILRLIPADVQEDAIDLVRATRENEEAKDPAGAAKKLIDWFADSLGIQPAELSQYLGHPIASATKPELKELRELGTAISEGHIRWRDALDERAGERRETKTIDVSPPAQEKPKVAKKAEPKPTAKGSVRERIYELLGIDGVTKADADVEIARNWPEGATDEQLEAWLAKGCKP